VSRDSPGSSSDDGEEGGGPERLDAIPDEDEGLDDGFNSEVVSKHGTQRSTPGQSIRGSKSETRHGSETPSLVQDKGARRRHLPKAPLDIPHTRRRQI